MYFLCIHNTVRRKQVVNFISLGTGSGTFSDTGLSTEGFGLAT
jgi:hypothetical protein